MKASLFSISVILFLTGCASRNNTPQRSVNPPTQWQKNIANAKTFHGVFSWNKRYGILIQVSGDRIHNASIIEYAKDGTRTPVPQSATIADNNIRIIFDEYRKDVIALAAYTVHTRPIIQADGMYVFVSGNKVNVSEIP